MSSIHSKMQTACSSCSTMRPSRTRQSFGRFCMFPDLPGMHKRWVRCAKVRMLGFTGCLLAAGRNDEDVRLARFMDELTSAGLGC